MLPLLLHLMLMTVAALPTVITSKCAGRLPQGHAIIGEPLPGGTYWQLMPSSNAQGAAAIMETPWQEPVTALFSRSSSESAECSAISVASLVSAKVSFFRKQQPAGTHSRASDLAASITVLELDDSVVKWEVDVAKLSQEHTGRWSVEIRLSDGSDTAFLAFELIIMAGCKNFTS